MSAEQSGSADSTGRTTNESTNDPGSTSRHARPQRSSDATRTSGGLRAWSDADSAVKRDGDGRSDPVDQDQRRTADIRRRDEERKGENRREGENESNETGGRTRHHNDGYHRRGRGGHHGHHYRHGRHDHRRREPQVTEEDGDENDSREAGRGERGSHSHRHDHRRRGPQITEEDGDENDRRDAGRGERGSHSRRHDHRHRDPQAMEDDGDENDRRETGRGEYGNRPFSSDHWDGRSPEEVIDGFRIGINKRNRLIEALENEKAEQANEIEQLKAQLSLLARSQTEREKLDQLLKERTAELSTAQAFLGRTDSISVTEVSKMVEMLNAEVLQASALVADSLSQRKMAKDDQADQAQVNDAMHAVKSFIGPRLQSMLLADIIDPQAKFDPTLSQIILQAGLVNACALVIKGWNPPDWESFSNVEKLYSTIRSSGEHFRNALLPFLTCFLSEGQAIGGRWRALAHTYITAQSENDIKAKSTEFLKQILRNLLIAIGWSARGPHVPTPPQYEERIENVMKKALEIRQVIGKGITSTDLQTHAIPFEQWFNSEFMNDAYGDGEDVPVLCTIELGLQYEKITTPDRAGGEQRESGTILKPKVVLVSALEGIRKAANV